MVDALKKKMDNSKDENTHEVKTEIEDVENRHNESNNRPFIQNNSKVDIDNEKFCSEIEMENNTQEAAPNEHTFEPSPCPLCEKTVLKNKFYLLQHMKQFHKDFKLLVESTNNLHEEEETNKSQNQITSLQKEWNAGDLQCRRLAHFSS